MRTNATELRAVSAAHLVAAALFAVACGHHGEPAPAARAASSAAAAAKTTPLERLAAGDLFDAYANDAAEADKTYRGRRYTIVANVVASGADSGTHQVVLGSDLRPLIAVGIDERAAAALVVGASLEVDCTVTGSTADIPNLDCGPNGLPRPVSPPP